MAGIRPASDPVAEGRWEQIQEDPIVGAGLDEASGTVYDRYGDGHQVHNLFIGRWFESGILGLLGIVLIVGSMFRTGWRAVVDARRERLLALGLFAGLVAFVIVAQSSPLCTSGTHWRR